jgi:D-3-phosphoglycerate dehydrogenase
MRDVKIISTSPIFGTVGAVPSMLESRGWKLVRLAEADLSRERVIKKLFEYAPEMEILVSGGFPVSAALISRAHKLKCVFQHGVGLDNIDIPAATKAGIIVCNAPGANANAVAELALGCMLAYSRRIISGHNAMTSGKWLRYVGNEIQNKTLGIVGLGNIGRILALKAAALGMNVVANDVCPDAAFADGHNINLRALPEVLSRSDFVSLHISGGRDNKKLLGAAELDMMQPHGLLMNFGRGEVLDMDALENALIRGRPAAAVLDVYPAEPPDVSRPLFNHPECIFLPHRGGDSREAQERAGLSILEGITSILHGEMPAQAINKETGAVRFGGAFSL